MWQNIGTDFHRELLRLPSAGVRAAASSPQGVLVPKVQSQAYQFMVNRRVGTFHLGGFLSERFWMATGLFVLPDAFAEAFCQLSKCLPQVAALFVRGATGSWTTARRMGQRSSPCIWGCVSGDDDVEHYFGDGNRCKFWLGLCQVLGLPPSDDPVTLLGLSPGSVSCLILPTATLAFHLALHPDGRVGCLSPVAAVESAVMKIRAMAPSAVWGQRLQVSRRPRLSLTAGPARPPDEPVLSMIEIATRLSAVVCLPLSA